ncbi:MAG: hypothetical protein ACXABG_15355 [Promethearchaeota archaeon]|jgi:GNAT superfamily N-acetyltransferase
MTDQESISVEIIENPKEILKFLEYGINIPVYEEFHDFIAYDLNIYKAKSLILKKGTQILAHTLVYDDGGEVLFFGFFSAFRHEVGYIELLLKEIVNYAHIHQYKVIRGPINPPTFIYGWGFMTEDSSKDLSISKPVNPPIYQQVFIQNGFSVKSKQRTLEGEIYQFPEHILNGYDFKEYEIYSPKNWDEIPRLKMQLLNLSLRNLASESLVTPSAERLFENFLKFMKKYGEIYMVKLIRKKQSKQFVGCFITLPNPISKNKEGQYNSFVGYTLTIDKEHRGKGLSVYLVKKVFDAAYQNGIRHISVPMEINVVECRDLAMNIFGLSYTRTHLILEQKIK